jgi:hypothetical protein
MKHLDRYLDRWCGYPNSIIRRRWDVLGRIYAAHVQLERAGFRLAYQVPLAELRRRDAARTEAQA